jgi:hypothetical protein
MAIEDRKLLDVANANPDADGTRELGTSSLRWLGYVLDKGAQVHSVKAYGATGDGVTDDTAEVQAAINAADAASGGTVYFPVGIYGLSSSLSVPDNVVLAGANKGGLLNFSGSCLRALAGFPANYLVRLVGTGATPFRSAQVRDLAFDGASVSGVLGAILVRLCRTALFSNIAAISFPAGSLLDFHTPSGSSGGTTLSTVINPTTVSTLFGIRCRGYDTSNFVTNISIFGGTLAGRGAGISGGIGLQFGESGLAYANSCLVLGTHVQLFEVGVSIFGDNNAIGCVTEDNGTGCIEDSGAGFTTYLGAAIADGITKSGFNSSGHLRDGTNFDNNHVLAPDALSVGDNDDYAITDGVNIYRITADASGSTLTGATGGFTGRRILIRKNGGGNLVIAHNDSGSSYVNRFTTGDGLDITLTTDGQHLIEALWDSQWRVVGVMNG